MATKKKSEQLIAIEEIEEKIYLIRGEKVMLDSDLAEIYGVTTKRLNEQVGRNIERFPEDFMFQLTDEETESLRSQFATSKKGRGGRRYNPYVFTEHGAVMLASVLNSPTAIEASLQVVRAFVKMRTLLALHQDLAERIEELEKTTDRHELNFEAVSLMFEDVFNNPKFLRRKIGFVEEKKRKSKK